jgi:4-hydroxy-tetrahydrodipicolinate synthase
MNRARSALHGSMTALATPFRAGKVDTKAFVQLCERQIARGTTGLVVCGSTGEAAAMRPEEQAELVQLAVRTSGARMPVIAGCGGGCTEAAATVAELAARAGADALLCAPTPYVKPSRDGFIAHIRVLAQASRLPIVLYDVPGRAGVPIRDETVAMLADQGLAIGIKDATADLSRPPRLRALCGDRFVQLSGDDASAAAFRAAGGDGCISVTANITPALCALLHTAWDRSDIATFAWARDLLAPLHEALFRESNPVPLKAALSVLGLAGGEVRLPLVEASRATWERLAEILPLVMKLEEAQASGLLHKTAGNAELA